MPAQELAGRYRLERMLGRGAMAEVWQAHDRVLDRPVAVKRLHVGADGAAQERFAREANAAAGLTHPNIVRVYDVGESEGTPFMVQECLGGGSLEDRLSPGEALDERDAGKLAHEVASGLAHAHARGLVHRDLKPGNLLFDDEGRTKIADFGVASLAGADTLTDTGAIVGTAAYLSPEQALGEPAVPASDVYAVGVLLYRVLCGRLPFEAEQPLELARKHVEEQPPPLRTGGRLAEIAMAALAKDWHDRPQGGAPLLAALSEPTVPALARPTDPVSTQATEVLRRSVEVERARRWPAWAALFGALAAVMAVGGALAFALLLDGSAPAQAPTRQPDRRPGATGDGAKNEPRTPAASTPAKTQPPAASTVPPPPQEPVPTPPVEPTPPPVEPPPTTPPPEPSPPVEPPPPTEPPPPPPPVEPPPPPPPPIEPPPPPPAEPQPPPPPGP